MSANGVHQEKIGRKILTLTNDTKSPDGAYSYIWLRDNCTETHTFVTTDFQKLLPNSQSLKKRIHEYRDFDFNVVPIKVELSDDGENLHVIWPPNLESNYSAEWLYKRNLNNPKVREDKRKAYLGIDQIRTWNSEKITKNLQTFQHNDVMSDEKALHDFLYAVAVDGVALVKNGPTGDRTMVKNWEKRIGLLTRSHYGKTFEVTARADGDKEFHGREIQFHADLPTYTRVPQLQMFHCLQTAGKGGLSVFCDGFYVAELIRKERPDIFEILSTVKLEYIAEGHHSAKERYDYDLRARHPVFQLNKDGQVEEVIFVHSLRTWFFDVDPEEVPKVYEAIKIFMDYCYRPENHIQLKLDTGDTVLFANTRVLHGRISFVISPGEPIRSINGCYFNWDFVKSKIREIRNRIDLPEKVISF